jgi:phosphoribosylanthranilate isomerase
MIDFITRLFRTEPGAKIRKLISQKQTQAVQLQRDGKLREYAKIMKEIEALEDEYIEAINESR